MRLTNEEAKKRLNSLISSYKIRIDNYVFDEDIEALNMGIEALKNQKTGHWIKDEMSIMFDIWTCSECGGGGDKHFKYCPHCGAKMEGE